jgi:hypothetical protein
MMGHACYVSQIAETPEKPAEEHILDPRYIAPEPENLLHTLDGMNEKEAFDLLDELTAPPKANVNIP